jgi:DNA repair protein RecN (Recombination protein N)
MDRGADMDQRLGTIRDMLAEIEFRIEDVSLSLRDIQKTVHMDPVRLEEVTERLELLNRLKQKYGPRLEDVLHTKERLASAIYDLEDKRSRVGRLKQEMEKLRQDMIIKAVYLSKKRKRAATDFKEEVEEELRRLHMIGTRFQVKFDNDRNEESARVDDLSVDGLDQVEFVISPNVGEELRPLSKIASGGELSRIILAMKTILARSGSVETIIFDEVDSGISGATAEVVGEKLLSLADYHQLVCITHLPQIASKGKTHFLVKKEVSGGRTQTLILKLDWAKRVQEIARLLGGRKITDQALAHAREMLG